MRSRCRKTREATRLYFPRQSSCRMPIRKNKFGVMKTSAPHNWPENYLQRFGTTVSGNIYKAPVFAYFLPSDVAVGAISDLANKAQGNSKIRTGSLAKRLNRDQAFLAASYSAGCVCGTLLHRPALARQLLRATIRSIAVRGGSTGIESVFASALQTAWSSLSLDEVALAIRTWERSIRSSNWVLEHGIVVVDGVHRTLRFAQRKNVREFSLEKNGTMRLSASPQGQLTRVGSVDD